MEPGLLSFFDDLKVYTFGLGLYASVIYCVEFLWFMDLRRDLKREKPERWFSYTFWEFCLFLLPLAITLCVVTVQALRCNPPPALPLATEEPAMIAAIAINWFLASEGAMLVAKMRQLRADENASATRAMAVWCGVFFCAAGILVISVE